MNLKSELSSAGIQLSPADFSQRVNTIFEQMFDVYTMDALLCRPVEALKYAAEVKRQLNTELNIAVILRATINFRKAAKAGTGRRDPNGPRNYNSILKRLGIDMTSQEFGDFVSNKINGMYKQITVDDIGCYPNEALDFCRYVKRELNSPELSDDTILAALFKTRKGINS